MKSKRLELATNDRLEVGTTIRRYGHIWTVTAAKERPKETERYIYMLERRAA
jgi:hypothetical protein